MNTYTAKIRWIRKGGDFAKGQYSRAHEGAFDGGAVVLGLDKLQQAIGEPVEEARQHSALESDSFTPDEIGLAIVGGLGVLAAVAGMLGYFFIGGRGILLGLLAFTLSRVVMRFWQVARPDAFPRNRASPSITMAFAIMWVFLSIVLTLLLVAMS